MGKYYVCALIDCPGDITSVHLLRTYDDYVSAFGYMSWLNNEYSFCWYDYIGDDAESRLFTIIHGPDNMIFPFNV